MLPFPFPPSYPYQHFISPLNMNENTTFFPYTHLSFMLK
jgi:hypothetical protein